MLYALIVGIVYIAGLPIAVFATLFRRRHKLFGDPNDPFVASTMSSYGFLYTIYGPNAWWWEVEELVRKLLLSAVVVLISPGSPLQARTSLTIIVFSACAQRAYGVCVCVRACMCQCVVLWCVWVWV